MKTYPKTKPSGVEWLGDVPEHWEVKRLKMAAHLKDKKVEADEENPVPYIGLEHIESWTGRLLLIDAELVPSGIANAFEAECVLFGKLRPYLAKACTPDFNGLCSTELLVLQGNDLNRHSLRYTLLSEGFIDLVDSSTYGSKMPRASWNFIGDCVIPIPPPPEQTAIATYLDRETGRIDELVSKKRELIERLKEKRTALISRTVTRGLPAGTAKRHPQIAQLYAEELQKSQNSPPSKKSAAKLPENHSLKPSEIEWLGEVPEGWEVRKFSREVAISRGQVNPEKEPYASMLLIGPEHVESGTGRLIHRATATDQAAESGKYFSRKGEVIYSKIRPALKKVVVAPEDCLCSADMYPLHGRQRLNNRFIAWFFLSQEFSGWSVLESDRVAMPKINRDTLNELRLPVPPLPEQIAIAAYLDAETSKLDALVAKVKTAIECLMEYRSAIITAAVTGKIDVRNGKKAD